MAEPPAEVTLDEEELGLGRIALLTVGELARQRGDVERALAPGQLARLAGGLTRGRGLDHLGDDHLGFGLVLLQPGGEARVDEALDHRPDFGRDQLVLGLGGELRIRHLHREDAGQPLAAVVAGRRDLLPLGGAGALRIGRDLPGQRRAEAGEVGAAVALGDVVGEAEHVLVVGVVPPHRHLDGDAVALVHERHRLVDERRLLPVEPDDEGFQAAVVEHDLLAALDAAVVDEPDRHAGVEEGELAQALLQGREVELHLREGAGGGQEPHLGAVLAAGVPHHRERRLGDAVVEAHPMLLASAPDGEIQLRRQGVHHRHAHAVQTAGDLVGVLVEFPARVQLGHDDLGRGDAFALVHIGRNTAPVVAHRHRAVGVEHYRHGIVVAGQRLVDGVVDDLVDHVVEARPVVGIADVHAGAFANGFKAFQDLDGTRAVLV